MSNYFFDTSALIKRYISEAGTTKVTLLTSPTSGNTIQIAQITQVEVMSAIMRRMREGTISPRTARAIRLVSERHMRREYTVIMLTEPIIKRASDLISAYPLRTYDSIQLATALEANRRLFTEGLPSLIFTSADNRLLSVAVAEGLPTENPTDP